METGLLSIQKRRPLTQSSGLNQGGSPDDFYSYFLLV